MSLCASCRRWLYDVVRRLVFDADLHECRDGDVVRRQTRPGSDDTTQLILPRAEATYKREVNNLFANRNDCWLCCRLWLSFRLVGKHIPGLLSDEQARSTVALVWRDSHIPVHVSSAQEPAFLGGGLQGRISFQINHADAPDAFSLVLKSLATRNECHVYRWSPSDDQGSLVSISAPDGWAGTMLDLRAGKIRQWMDRCTERHSCVAKHSSSGLRSQFHSVLPWTKQKRDKDEAFLPTRLLQLGSDDSRLKLVYSSNLGRRAGLQYATLSHCWGSERFVTLSQQNHDAFIKKISASELEKTFRETIRLCRMLGFSLLWIDSLCIIQDDQEDWKREAPLMHKVYGCSQLNIAASASRAASEGLVRPLHEALFSSLKIEYPLAGCHIADDPQTDMPQLLRSVHDNSPLLTRGWVTQELFLAPRIVFFTDSQIYWHCRAQFAQELVPAGWPEVAIEAKPWNCLYGPAEEPAGARTSEHVDYRWAALAADYSATFLTKKTDRLAALAGLTAHFETLYANAAVQTAPVLGCWRHNLVQWLLWLPVGPSRGSERTRFALPTWSWLSAPFKVSFEDAFKDQVWTLSSLERPFLMHVEHVDVQFEDPSFPQGPVRSARIVVDAPVFQLSNRDCGPYDEKPKAFAPHDFSSVRVQGRGFEPLTLFSSFDQAQLQVRCCFDFANQPLPISEPVECIFVAHQVRDVDYENFWALMLKPCGVGDEGLSLCQRWGIVLFATVRSRPTEPENPHVDVLRGFFSPDKLEHRRIGLI